MLSGPYKAMLQNRLAHMTPVNCLAAVYNWLRNEEGIIPKSTNLVTEAGALWMEFRELATAHDSDDSEPIAVLRALLTRRIPANAETKITDDVLCIDLHEHDPTPRVSFPLCKRRWAAGGRRRSKTFSGRPNSAYHPTVDKQNLVPQQCCAIEEVDQLLRLVATFLGALIGPTVVYL